MSLPTGMKTRVLTALSNSIRQPVLTFARRDATKYLANEKKAFLLHVVVISVIDPALALAGKARHRCLCNFIPLRAAHHAR